MPVDAPGDNAGQEAPQALGAMLAAERERQGLSRTDAAQRLHMSPSQVEALERGDYATLPRGTFLRGFVRNYAKVLGLEPEGMLAMLAEAKPRDPAPRIVVPTQNIRFDPLGERFSSPYVKAATLAVVVVAVAFAAMYWVMFVRPKPPALAGRASVAADQQAPAAIVVPPEVKPPAQPPAEPMPSQGAAAPGPQEGVAAPPKAAAAKATSPAKDAAARATPAPKDAKAAPPAKPTVAAAAPPRDQPREAAKDASATAQVAKSGPRKAIHFHFDGDSWVEVRDASGKVLFQKLNPAGSDADLAARPPLDVIVGNAPEVRMTLDGADFPLEPHTNVAVARFTLE